MEFYAKVIVPPTCYIHEATYWIAFGRVPEFIFDERGYDYRADVEPHLDHLEPVVELSYYDLVEEVGALVPGTNRQSFAEKLDECSAMTAEEIEAEASFNKEQYEELCRKHPAIDWPGAEDVLDDLRKQKLAAAEKIVAVTDVLDHMLESARASLFASLIKGELRCEGVKPWLDRSGGEDNEVIRGEMQSIPTTAWKLSRIDWERAELGDPQREYGWIGAQVSWAELIALFPGAHLAATEVKGQKAGMSVIFDADSVPTPTLIPRRRGRPSKGDGWIEKAVVGHFKALHGRGQLAGKVEATVQEAIDWTFETFGETVGRSTMQKWLKPVTG